MASRSGVAPGWGPGRINGRRWGLPLTANGDFLLSLDRRWSRYDNTSKCELYVGVPA